VITILLAEIPSWLKDDVIKSWVIGRSGAISWIFIAMAFASKVPIQIGKVAVVRLLLQDHDVLARGHVHTDAVDLDLDQIVRFSLLSPKAGDVSTCVWTEPTVRAVQLT
jgi:hypothetical protein